MYYFFFNGKKTSVSNSTPCNDKRFLGKSECVTSYVILPAPLILNFSYPKIRKSKNYLLNKKKFGEHSQG